VTWYSNEEAPVARIAEEFARLILRGVVKTPPRRRQRSRAD
jgi:hypothetical protein